MMIKKRRAWRVIRARGVGVVYIITSLFLGLVAVNSGNNMLYMVTALMLAYMLASGIVGRGNIRGAVLSLSLPDEIYASTPCAVEVTVRNKNRFTPLLLIEAALAQKTHKKHTRSKASVFFPVVQPGSAESTTLLTTFPLRGRHVFEDIELSSGYPFNFFTRYWPVETDPEAIVFPHPLVCDLEVLFASVPDDGAEDEDYAAADSVSLAESDILGVRPYVEGDSMKRIHWKSSARTGKLKTRIYDGDARSRRQRVIDVDRLVGGGAPSVESALSMAAYAVLESAKTGLPVGMIIGGESIPPASGHARKKELLTKLALYGER